MRKEKCSRRDTIQLIGTIFVPLMFDTMKN
jgi:hypothetical protein